MFHAMEPLRRIVYRQAAAVRARNSNHRTSSCQINKHNVRNVQRRGERRNDRRGKTRCCRRSLLVPVCLAVHMVPARLLLISHREEPENKIHEHSATEEQGLELHGNSIKLHGVVHLSLILTSSPWTGTNDNADILPCTS